MATKAENEANMRFFGSILGVVLLSVFLINTVIVYWIYNKKYGIKDADYRVNDSLQFTSYILKGAVPFVALILFSILGAFIFINIFSYLL